ncbi:MAG: DMT family transporter [Desulfovibrio sp.]|nr:DMT family transporter [Desulfovibrio sp.]MBR4746607.1 DMT family transporter [Desulfovibrio sp.]MBR5050493.1 DMT family transporter [Desulfovibrio sp.]MBR6468504.1 DMT family transporter [Desulfovibrio sp.]
MTRNAKALCFALATVLSWSTVSTAFKLALRSLSPMQMTAVAMGTAALALVPFLAAEAGALAGRGAVFTPRRTGLAVLAGLVIFLYYLVLFHGYDHLPAQVAQPVNYTWSIMLAILLSLVRRTPLRPRQVLWMCVAWAGTAVIALGGRGVGPVEPLGVGLIVLSTVLFAVYWVVSDVNDMPSLPAMLICFTVACLLAGGCCLALGEGLPAPKDCPWAVYLGFFELSLPFLCWREALRLTERVALMATLPLSTPFLALVWIHLVLGEPILATTVAGLALIVAGTFLQVREGERRN